MKILIAEDERISRRLLEATLRKWGYEVVVTVDGSEAWEVLRRDGAPPIAVLDWMMPGIDGVELCRKIRATETTHYTYIILLTSMESRKDIIAGLESGADDYITKPFDAEELKYRIRIGRRIADLEKKLRQLACIDSLTGVLNRRSFMERLAAECSRSGREKTSLSVIMTDIDFFKKVNDRFGHQAGDVVLQELAGCINRSCRIYDFVGRYGGEEFFMCCPGAAGPQTVKIAERIRKKLEAMKIHVPGEVEPLSITASFGTASRQGKQESADSIVNRADKALYRAKSEGRNRVCTADD